MRPNILEIKMEQRSAEWYAARANRITGSQIGAILNLSPFAGSGDVMRALVRGYHGEPNEFKGNIATEHGVTNEPNALEDYKLMYSTDVKECGFYVHQDFEWLGASPDGLIDDDGLIEIKCPYGMRHAQSEDDFKSITEQKHYYAQIQYQLFCTGRKWCHFFQWSPYASKLEVVNFHPPFIHETLPKLKAFYDRYLTEREENYWRYTDGGYLVERYKKAKAALEVAQVEVDEAKQALIDATDGKGGKIGDINITLATRKGSVSYAKAIKDLMPDADLEPYRSKDSTYWVVK